MCAYVLMKILESSANRYDKGIKILSLGRIDAVYDRLVSRVNQGDQVLDIGCGTGALTIRAAQRGAHVRGIDKNPQMLEIAKIRVVAAQLDRNIELLEMSIAELDTQPTNHFDVVMSGLCFSELSEDEINYTLQEIHRIMKIDGLVLIADEIRPENILKRIIHYIIKIPLAFITYLLTQTTTGSVTKLTEKMENMYFKIDSVRINRLGNFIELVATKPVGDGK